MLPSKTRTWLVVLVAVGMALTMLPATSGAAKLPASFADLVEKVSPAVVNIRTEQTVKGGPMQEFMQRRPRRGDPEQGPGGPPGDLHEFFRRFFGGPEGGDGSPREFKRRSLGSGVLVDPKGYVVTNNHVVAQADQILVRLKTGEELPAKIVGRDKKTDLALIKVEAKDDLPYLPLGDSDKMRVGDWVVAVGNPFGLEHTVTAGIISAKGRFIGAGPYDNFIQTDASINPGNSGGPLINLDGEVVGINTAIVAQGQGIGFAIPVNLAKAVVGQLREKGRVVRGWLGVYIQPVTKELAEKFGLDEAKGALVADVIKGSPAEKAGLQRGDVVVEFDGKEVEDMHALPRMVAATPVGRKVELTVLRKGDKKEFEVTIGELEEEKAAAKEAEPTKSELGLSLQEVTPELAKELGLDKAQGLVVTAVASGSPAEEAGIQRGDVIMEAAQEEIKSLADFQRIAGSVKPGQGLLLLVKRGEMTRFVVIKATK